LSQLPASFLLLSLAERIRRRDILLAACGALIVLGTSLIVFTNGLWIAAGTAVIGFAGAGCFIILLAVPPSLSHPQDLHRVTAAMFTTSYTMAVVVPLMSGAIWDLSGVPAVAFAPIAICGLALIMIALSTRAIR
jgi:CP family cyanate transporter-like MFS transporter